MKAKEEAEAARIAEEKEKKEAESAILAEAVAFLESKVIEQEEEIVIYKGMYEDIQEDYDLVFRKYNEQVEQNAAILDMVKRMKERLGQYESALLNETNRVHDLEEHISMLQQTKEYQVLAKLHAENERLQEMVSRQKAGLFQTLTGNTAVY